MKKHQLIKILKNKDKYFAEKKRANQIILEKIKEFREYLINFDKNENKINEKQM